MVKLTLKNLKEIKDEISRDEFKNSWEGKRKYVEEYFKNYDKPLTLEVIVNNDGKVYKVSVSLNLKSKKLLHAEEDKDLMKATSRLFSEFRKQMKKQKELERKDYLYKRKR